MDISQSKNAEKAYKELVAIGAPVMDEGWSSGYFRISGEMNDTGGTFGGNNVIEDVWADYYEEYCPAEWEFGINPKIDKILEKYGLFCEWVNAGVADVYDIK